MNAMGEAAPAVRVPMQNREGPLWVGFPDSDPLGRPSLALFSNLDGLLGDRLLIAEEWLSSELPTVRARLIERVRNRHRIICFGIGAGARAALLFGSVLRAERVITWAPSAAPGAGKLDAEAVALTYDTTASPPPSPHLPSPSAPAVHITSCSDTVDTDIAVARSLRPAVGIRLERIEEVPYSALEQALAQTNYLSRMITAIDHGRSLPKPHHLQRSWQSAFAHQIVLEPGLSPSNDGGFALHGTLRNSSPKAFSIGQFERDLIRIGARIISPGDDPTQPGSARFYFGSGALEAGATLPFRLELPREAIARGFEARVALVCEGRFWFDDQQFPNAILGVPADALKHQGA
ncbi:hypothetical protein [Sphingobium sp. CFD-2]|jgi:hypothetical protein|uniref:hypothetical protein n=1 Tax=Sphingobium sp. CFD-2 TaxID=2878542 RepID=UPI00214A94E9|nr:hypothetical protein [Sphingobium sp. CFD-2]TNF05221.1 MAG: hypothetical protein EP321_04055 [Sphingomonadales bacterium]